MEDNKILEWTLLILLPVIMFFLSFTIGRYPIAPIDVIKTILSPIIPSLTVSPSVSTIVFQIRLPRIIAAMLVGASLSIAGAAFQGILKTPLYHLPF